MTDLTTKRNAEEAIAGLLKTLNDVKQKYLSLRDRLPYLEEYADVYRAKCEIESLWYDVRLTLTPLREHRENLAKFRAPTTEEIHAVIKQIDENLDHIEHLMQG